MKRLSLIALVALSFSACSKQNAQPAFVQEIKQSRATITSETGTHERVISEVTLLKSAILGRTFLYSDTLQTSSIKDGDVSVTLLSMALGTLPAEFKVLDNKLRLVTDGRMNFESDINHPSRLILEFKIVKQDENSITIRAEEASPIIDTFLFDNKPDKPRPAKQASFIRSMEYVETSELFMIESTVEMADGSVAEVMETLTPRERVISADAKPIYADKALNPLADRYRFLAGPKFFTEVKGKGRVETKAAEHFAPKNGEPIKWWASQNTPEQYVIDVKNGVEGWNRYSQAANGTDLVKFMGKLPADAKLGDPRYNVVVWDQVAEAGAAYESQNSDPFTGIQLHSLVYLPAAWVNIGKSYWKDAARAESGSQKREGELKRLLKNHTFGGRSLPAGCLEGPIMHVTAESKQSPEEFGRKLLRDTLFHEVGHALGLAHNFKGSLTFDADTGKGFSTSIMDYNYYSEEMAAYDTIDGSSGPLLEYDRQIISQIYNDGKDVKSSDPVLPACADEEADSTKDGVDPLCLRYDIGKDPTKQAQRAVELLSNAQLRSGKLVSLPVALENIVSELPAANSVASFDDVKKAVETLRAGVNATANMYIGGTAGAVGVIGGLAMKSLYVARPGVIPEGYNEAEMRTRAYELMQTIMSTNELPAATKTALANVRGGVLAFVQSSAGFQALAAGDQAKALADLLKALDEDFAKMERTLLAKARVRLIGSLKYSADAPLSFLDYKGTSLDLESEVVKALESSSSPKAGSTDRLASERLEAAKTLATYKSSASAKDAMERLKTSVDAEILASRDARQRESLRKLREALP